MEFKIPKESQTTMFAPMTSPPTTPKKDTPTKTEVDLRNTSHPTMYSLSNLASTPGPPRKVAQSDSSYLPALPSPPIVPHPLKETSKEAEPPSKLPLKGTEESKSAPTSSDASIKEPSKKKESRKSAATSTPKRRRSSVKQPTASLGLIELRLQQKQANAQSLALNKEYALQRQAAQAELRLQQQQARAQVFISKKGLDLQREEANARLNTMKATAALSAMRNPRQRAPIVILHVNNPTESHKGSANDRIHRQESEPVIPIYRAMSRPNSLPSRSLVGALQKEHEHSPVFREKLVREESRPRNIEHDITIDPRRERALVAAPQVGYEPLPFSSHNVKPFEERRRPYISQITPEKSKTSRPEKPNAQSLYSTHRYLTHRGGKGDSEQKEDTRVRKRRAAVTPPPLRIPEESKKKRLQVFRVDKDGEIHKTSERAIRLINSNPRSDRDHPSTPDHVASTKKAEKSTPLHGPYTAAIHTNRPIRVSPTHNPYFRLKKAQVYPQHRVSAIAP